MTQIVTAIGWAVTVIGFVWRLSYVTSKWQSRIESLEKQIDGARLDELRLDKANTENRIRNIESKSKYLDNRIKSLENSSEKHNEEQLLHQHIMNEMRENQKKVYPLLLDVSRNMTEIVNKLIDKK